MLCAFHAYYTLLHRVNPCKCMENSENNKAFVKAFVIFCGTWHRPLVHSADALRRCARLVAPPVTAVKLLRSSLNFDVHTAHTHFHTTGLVPSTVVYTILWLLTFLAFVLYRHERVYHWLYQRMYDHVSSHSSPIHRAVCASDIFRNIIRLSLVPNHCTRRSLHRFDTKKNIYMREISRNSVCVFHTSTLQHGSSKSNLSWQIDLDAGGHWNGCS
jgi:hypothetical protein